MQNESDSSLENSENLETRAIDLFRETRSWADLVGDQPSVELEIGSGKGLFLQNASKVRADHFFVGIEIAAKFANRAASRLAKQQCRNTVMLRGDAKKFLMDVVPSQSLVRAHVYFPDPWWRNKHKKRRVLNEQTLADIERALKSNGEFHFWTDVLDYYEHICDLVMRETKLAGPKYVPERTVEHHMDYTTHFERRARRNEQPVYRAIFIKHD